ncbi:carbohydrate ABC transporter permease [Paenibacillus sp. GP183]|uniref:carbohydrate ABC transporter permease n=1 Tax=Paenibacillus sp. GP183 TaxID=1882751 RepID=UPI0008959D60|nr:carbohydrate ABC transporter permease [Paenibacillus sp. GP183]SEC42467.1 raffinose/stachyose/melibiose transport system permease protein [Paenibacillus sp. GP183]
MSHEGTKSVSASIGHRAGSALIFLILIASAVFTLFPIYMGLLNSLKTEGAMMNNILSIPTQLEFKNYGGAFHKTNFLRSLWNTSYIAVVGLIGIIGCASMAGYKLSRSPGKLSAFLFLLFVMSTLIPFHSIMITLTRIAKNLHVQGSTTGLGLIYIGMGVAFAIFLYHGFVKSIPRELDEAAVIDGCSEFRLFVVIIFPLLLPITATIAILNLLWIWNDFLLPLLMLTDFKTYTLLLSTNMLFGQYGNNDWSAILSSLILALLPVVVLFFLLQKYILQGIADGAIKG